MNSEVQKKFNSYPVHARKKILSLRQLILEVASNTAGVGDIEETLKWGEPAYLTPITKSGTTIRIDWKPKNPEQYALYVNCRTTLIADFKSLFPNDFSYEGNRAILFNLDDPLLENELRHCISLALTYHL